MISEEGHKIVENVSDIISVELSERSYDIVIGNGLISRLGTLISPLLARPFTVIVTDENVADEWLQPATEALSNSGISCETIILPAGEASKSFASFEHLTSELLTKGVERRDHIIALGGGVIGDLTGFAAATLRRGMGFIQVPTSLLAQVDSSVGGKTGINSTKGKNLVGAFHQPALVVADLDTLDTLPMREMKAGYAEVVKYGLIDDPGFFGWLEQNGESLIAGDKAAQGHAVSVCCRAKARIVAEDELEKGKRALLNLGHTFGHALEAECGYDGSLLHGEAVAIGMVQALQMSEAMGICEQGSSLKVAEHLSTIGLPVAIADLAQNFKVDDLISHMMQDKKVESGKLVFVLASAIGAAEVRRDVSLDQLRMLLDHGQQGQ